MDFDYQTITEDSRETEKLGEALGIILKQNRENFPRLVCLSGKLGSGKTTFVRGLARGLGLSQRITSPTFVIIKRYSLEGSKRFFYHLDLYRLGQEAGTMADQIREILSSTDAVVCVEWPENSDQFQIFPRLDIGFGIMDGGKHQILSRLKEQKDE